MVEYSTAITVYKWHYNATSIKHRTVCGDM